jgi:TonB family protein
VSANRPDISQIRKYLNGELDERAMYRLERQAQNDQFLMDMITAMEMSDMDHQPNLAEINQLIDKRIEQDKKRTVPLWRSLSIAASVIIALGIGGWLLTQNKTQNQLTAVHHKQKAPVGIVPLTDDIAKADTLKIAEKLARNTTRHETEPLAQTDKVLIDSGKNLLAAVNSFAEPKAKAMTMRAKEEVNRYGYLGVIKPNIDTSLFDRKGFVSNESAKEKMDANASIAAINAKEVKIKDSSINHVLLGKVAGVQVESPTLASANMLATITGHVVDKTDNSPLPGVMIRQKDSEKGTVTDAHGNFSITVPANATTLNIAYIGYQSQEVKAKSNSDLKIALAATNNTLSEVVVTSYGAAGKTENAARPAIGWSSYNDYLKENAKMPNGQTGVVKVSFPVNSHGEVGDVTVKKGVDAAMDRKAIELVKNGPKWYGDSDGKTHTVTLRIRFRK